MIFKLKGAVSCAAMRQLIGKLYWKINADQFRGYPAKTVLFGYFRGTRRQDGEFDVVVTLEHEPDGFNKTVSFHPHGDDCGQQWEPYFTTSFDSIREFQPVNDPEPMPTHCKRIVPTGWSRGGQKECGGLIVQRDGFNVCKRCGVSYGASK